MLYENYDTLTLLNYSYVVRSKVKYCKKNIESHLDVYNITNILYNAAKIHQAILQRIIGDSAYWDKTI